MRCIESLSFFLFLKMQHLGFIFVLLLCFGISCGCCSRHTNTPPIAIAVFDPLTMSRFPNIGTFIFVIAEAHEMPKRHLAPRWSLGPQCKLWDRIPTF